MALARGSQALPRSDHQRVAEARPTQPQSSWGGKGSLYLAGLGLGRTQTLTYGPLPMLPHIQVLNRSPIVATTLGLTGIPRQRASPDSVQIPACSQVCSGPSPARGQARTAGGGS